MTGNAYAVSAELASVKGPFEEYEKNADAVLKAMKTTLDDGRKVLAKRRGLKITLKVGEAKGEGLLRRVVHGPDVQEILRRALAEAGEAAGVGVEIEGGTVYLNAPP